MQAINWKILFRDYFLGSIVSSLLLCSPLAHAETPPDAGTTLRDVVPDTHALPRSDPTLTIPDAKQQEATDTTPFSINRFQIEGARLVSEPVLQALIRDIIGDARTLADINKAAARITAYYRDQGFPLARAYLPPQELNNGTVLIQVLEGKLGGIRLDNHSHLDNAKAEAMAQHMPAGEPLRIAEVNRAILLLRDTPGVGDVQASLAAGEKPRETQLTLDLTPAPLINGRLEADNHGSLFTGRYRAGGTVNLDSFLGYGERFSLQILASDEALYYGRLAAQTPVGSDGMSLGFNATHVRYELGDIFSKLDATGRVNSGEMTLAYPFVRDLAFNLSGQASLRYSDLKDEIGATATVVDKTTTKATFALVMNSRDGWLGGGSNQAYAGLSSGNLSIDTASARALDAVRAKTDGGYGILNLEVSRLQFVTERISLWLSGKAQLATKNLDSSEKFFLGGPYAIRAYPVGEGSGDEGWMTTAEARYAFIPNLYGSVFYDAGTIRVNRDAFLTTSNLRHLSGAGIGFGGSYRAFDWKTSIAWRNSGEPVSEKDKSPRIWLQGSMRF